jgi:two-component system cell cycle response regulator
MSHPPDLLERYTVALQGFSAFERATLASFFRLAARRAPAYVQVDLPEHSDFVIADADHADSLDAVQVAGRTRDTVFVGAQAPAGAMAWLQRPIDPMHIVRELDALVERRRTAPGVFSDEPMLPDVDLLLPDIHSTLHAAATSPVPAGATQSYQGGAGRDVLVVDDSPVARKFLALRLQRLGYHVQVASSGEQALALLAHWPFAIVFIDVVLGPADAMDGLRLCHAIKHGAAVAGGQTPAVVMATGLTGSTDRVRGSLAGCDAYLTKPLMEADFIAALREVDPLFAWTGAA